MVEGDKWEMYIPSDLAYGDRGRPPKIGGGDCLIFTMVRHSMPKVTPPSLTGGSADARAQEILKIKGGKVPKTELR